MWIRMDCDVSDDRLWEEMGQELEVDAMQAMGHYLAFLGKYAQHTPGAVLAILTDATVEKWANWRATPGGFARVLRGWCADEDDGTLRGFRRRNEKLLLKQVKDAQKRHSPKQIFLRRMTLDRIRQALDSTHLFLGRKPSAYSSTAWRYFCGVCWKMIREGEGEE
jgi:hypothetical protein